MGCVCCRSVCDGGPDMSDAFKPPRKATRHDCADYAPATIPDDVPERSLWTCPKCHRRWRLTHKASPREMWTGFHAEGEWFRGPDGSTFWRTFRTRFIGRLGT